MIPPRTRLALGLAIIVVVVLCGGVLLLAASWPPELRPALGQWIQSRWPVLLMVLAGAVVAAMAGARSLASRELGFVDSLSHDLDLMQTSRPDLRVSDGVPTDLARAVNALADAHDALRARDRAQIDAATRELAEERDLLAAVLAHLPAAVIACTQDGRILLYTPAAATLVRDVAPDAFLGLGRSLFGLFRRSAIVHGLTRMASSTGDCGRRASASALLATRGGRLLHARFTPLAHGRIEGFFLALAPFEPADTAKRPDHSLPVEDMSADTLLAAVRSNLSRDADAIKTVDGGAARLWVAADSFSLSAVLRDYRARLGPVEQLGLAIGLDDDQPQLVLSVSPAAALPEHEWQAWLKAPLSAHGYHLPLSPLAVGQRHGGAPSQFQAGDRVQLRLPLCRVESPAGVTLAAPTQVAYLPVSPEPAGGEDALDALSYTVFDTETTGLDPSGGDQIIAVGAIRVVGGQIRSDEVFESLVATTRRIDPAAQQIHGIDASMLEGQPPADEVMLKLRRFAEGTVMVGHNVAFDRRFLELQAGRTGVHFDLPVLDTLLLSQQVYASEGGHSLEDIAGRLGVSVVGRHTALGDAIVTAEIFQRLVPLLRAKGITTLDAALAASARSRSAGLTY